MSSVGDVTLEEFIVEAVEILTRMEAASARGTRPPQEAAQTWELGLHTLEGNARAFGLHEYSEVAAEVLDFLREASSRSVEDDLGSIVRDFVKRSREYLRAVSGRRDISVEAFDGLLDEGESFDDSDLEHLRESVREHEWEAEVGEILRSAPIVAPRPEELRRFVRAARDRRRVPATERRERRVSGGSEPASPPRRAARDEGSSLVTVRRRPPGREGAAVAPASEARGADRDAERWLGGLAVEARAVTSGLSAQERDSLPAAVRELVDTLASHRDPRCRVRCDQVADWLRRAAPAAPALVARGEDVDRAIGRVVVALGSRLIGEAVEPSPPGPTRGELECDGDRLRLTVPGACCLGSEASAQAVAEAAKELGGCLLDAADGSRRLELPAREACLDVLLVGVRGGVRAVAAHRVRHVVTGERIEIATCEAARATLRVGGVALPMLDLSSGGDASGRAAVVVAVAGGERAIVVDEIVDEERAVVPAPAPGEAPWCHVPGRDDLRRVPMLTVTSDENEGRE